MRARVLRASLTVLVEAVQVCDGEVVKGKPL
jgi:hypothetical protein